MGQVVVCGNWVFFDGLECLLAHSFILTAVAELGFDGGGMYDLSFAF